MKTAILGVLSFVTAFAFGAAISWAFALISGAIVPAIYSSSQKSPTIASIPRSSESNHPKYDFEPEFFHVSLDESSAHTTMDMVLSDGSAALCTATPEREPKNWIVLQKSSSGYKTVRRPVIFGRVEKTEFGSYSAMKFRDSKSAIFLLSDNGTLNPGKVKTVYRRAPGDLSGTELYPHGLAVGASQTFSINGDRYRLRGAFALDERDAPITVLVLSNGLRSQILWFEQYFYGDWIGVDWVGDIDGDGRLDLLFSYFRKNGGQMESLLFLSSFATKGRLVGIGGFYSGRCTAS